MNPSSPVCLTTEAVDITMEAADHFFFELKVDGVFQSSHSKEFHPHLPHDRSFKAGSVWPNPEEHPKGAKPKANGNFSYSWIPDIGKPNPVTSTPGTIRVTSGASNS
jgi:hypothetical protein